VVAPPQTYPFNLVPFIVLAYIVLGVVAYFVLRQGNPEKLAAFGSILADEPITKAEEGGIFDDRSPHTPTR
jgi:hypothetical protein